MGYDTHCQLRDVITARSVAPYGDDSLVARATQSAMDKGCTILQTHKLASRDERHVRELLFYFDPPLKARVLDAGSGLGTVAAWMRMMRPDLKFVLLNISVVQLRMLTHKPAMPMVAADFHQLPLIDRSLDAMMFNFSLGHGFLERCMAEAARVLRPGGILFIYDLTSDDQRVLINTLGYRAHALSEIMEAALAHGFVLTLRVAPHANMDEFNRVVGHVAGMAYGLHRTWPVITRFRKVQ